MKISARQDLLVVIVTSVLAAILCVKFDLSERLVSLTRPMERLQLDEFPGVALVIAVCMTWFATRRYAEARGEVMLRRVAEQKLTEALDDNQRLARKYVDTQETERKALARDLHDELGQYVNAIKLDAVSMRGSTAGDAAAQALAHNMIRNIDRVYEVVRGLIHELRPVGLDDLGIAAALDHCVNEWRARLPAVSIELHVDKSVDDLNEVQALAVYRLVQEGLTNVARHAGATHVRLEVQRGADGTRVAIVDDGRGADLTLPRSGLGLIGMRERVIALGGALELRSASGNGFRIVATVPAALSRL